MAKITPACLPEDLKKKIKRNVAENFDQSVTIYQAFEDKHRFFSALALKLAEAIGLKEGSTVLDIGCGYGISSQVLDRQFRCHVLGVDLSHEMIAAGQSMCNAKNTRLIAGDGENLSRIVGESRFDYALYNASIFIFPDVSKTIKESFKCLRIGGKIAFSFYPQIIGEKDEDLLNVAFNRLGEPPPRHRVITDYSRASQVLEQCCGNIEHHRWVRPIDIVFLQDFFSIPAQSASLFPKKGYENRRDLVKGLFSTLGDRARNGHIIWRMAEGTKVTASSS